MIYLLTIASLFFMLYTVIMFVSGKYLLTYFGAVMLILLYFMWERYEQDF